MATSKMARLKSLLVITLIIVMLTAVSMACDLTPNGGRQTNASATATAERQQFNVELTAFREIYESEGR